MTTGRIVSGQEPILFQKKKDKNCKIDSYCDNLQTADSTVTFL